MAHTKATGRCVRCDKPRDDECAKCKTCRNEMRRLRRERIAQGLCAECGTPAVTGLTLCEKHREIYRNKANRYWKQVGRKGSVTSAVAASDRG